MNILIVGNGFDLTHELPTKYKDFLKFCIDGGFDNDNFTNLKNESDEFNKYVKENLWIEYFKECGNLKDGWIDFELEISKAIQYLNMEFNNVKDKVYNGIKEVTNVYEFKEVLNPESKTIKKYDLVKLRKRLENDLNNLIKALDMYLTYIVESMEIKKYSPDIKEVNFDKVLSFNYTHTYAKEYNNNIECDFIHGETNKNPNNMVLGIDEYTPRELLNLDVEYIKFKKYFQRIHKKTGNKYKKWIDKMATNNYSSNGIMHLGKEKQQVYIFGHSLDVTDRDILREIILNANVKTTIFYLNEEVYAQQIANLVKVIGKDELIDRVSSINPTIIFKKQQEMICKEIE